jgi:squalene-associated FAD-dependent desaturase
MGATNQDMAAIRNVGIVGAGVAGLAAADALTDAGYQVELLERRPYIGGRASSYEHPSLGEVVDCQHVLLGCCTNLIHLCEHAGIGDKIRWYETLNFLEPGGRRTSITPASLPVPLHFLPSFLRAPMLGLRDKLAIARGLLGFVKGIPADDDQSVEQYLKQTGQTDLAIRHFWLPVLECTLNDGPAHCSIRYAGQVFRELFLRSATGSRLGIPTVPLSEFYDGVGRKIESHGGKLRLRTGVQSLAQGQDGRWTVITGAGNFNFDAVILALPFEQTQKLLATLPESAQRVELESKIEHFIHAPYTTVHLWYDREITDLDHAALLDTRIQWIFHKSRIRRWGRERGSYVELVIAASRRELEMERAEILGDAIRELESFFPEARNAKLVKSAILKEARATFSVLPGLEKDRPHAESPWPGLLLAGDWTDTGWPATMEGAARSGYLAAEAVAKAAGAPQKFLQADIAASGFMRFIG